MTTKEVLEIVHDRKLRVVIRDGRPVLVQPKTSDPATPALLAVLTRHWERIIEVLTTS